MVNLCIYLFVVVLFNCHIVFISVVFHFLFYFPTALYESPHPSKVTTCDSFSTFLSASIPKDPRLSEFPVSVKRPAPGAALFPSFSLTCKLAGENALKWVCLFFFSMQNDRVSAVGTKPHCPLTLSPVE